MTKGAQTQPAKGSGRVKWDDAREMAEFAHKRDKRRRAKQLAKAAKRKQRK